MARETDVHRLVGIALVDEDRVAISCSAPANELWASANQRSIGRSRPGLPIGEFGWTRKSQPPKIGAMAANRSGWREPISQVPDPPIDSPVR
jgi:hypothetical protein